MLRTKVKKFFTVEFLIRNVFVPLTVLVAYSGSYALFTSYFIPEGVTYEFTHLLFQFGLIFIAAIGISLFVYSSMKRRDGARFKAQFKRISFSNFFLLLLPLSPIAQYLLINQKFLSLTDGLFVVGFFVIFSAIYMIVIPSLLSFLSSKRMLTSVGMAFVFMVLNMASLSRYYSWLGRGSNRIQVVYLVVIFIVTWLLLGLKNNRDLTVVTSIYLVATIAVQIQISGLNVGQKNLPAVDDRLVSTIGSRTPSISANVYLLIYDAYAPAETMRAYGIDNSVQEAFLMESGFVLYPAVYSVGPSTLDTMNTVFNLSVKDDDYGKRIVSGDGMVHHAFKYAGYQTAGIFPNDYMFRGIGSSYDYSIPERSVPPYVYMISSILMGEFRFNLWFEKYSQDEYLKFKEHALVEVARKRSFVYSHSNYPSHSQNSGACLPDETNLYKERLARANTEMRQDVQTISEHDPQAIIIIAGDHGPYLTKNCVTLSEEFDQSEIDRLDIQDRYGTFLAIRWPDEDYVDYDEIKVLQDVFPAVFAYLYHDPEFLNLKVTPITIRPGTISGVVVDDGVILGGVDDGALLFEGGQ